jgi:hypothetical protein
MIMYHRKHSPLLIMSASVSPSLDLDGNSKFEFPEPSAGASEGGGGGGRGLVFNLSSIMLVSFSIASRSPALSSSVTIPKLARS